MTKFKVGDRVLILEKNTNNTSYNGRVGNIKRIDSDGDIYPICVTFDDGDYGWTRYVQLITDKIPSPDDMVCYMAYGTGCNNKSDLVKTEKELKEQLSSHSKDSSWTGRIIGYKLTPLYEAEEVTKFKVFKVPKVTKKVVRRKR